MKKYKEILIGILNIPNSDVRWYVYSIPLDNKGTEVIMIKTHPLADEGATGKMVNGKFKPDPNYVVPQRIIREVNKIINIRNSY